MAKLEWQIADYLASGRINILEFLKQGDFKTEVVRHVCDTMRYLCSLYWDIQILYWSAMQFDDVVRIQRGEHVNTFQLWPGCSKKHARHHVLALTATNGPLANILLKTTGNSSIFCFCCISFSFFFFFIIFVFLLFFNQFAKSLSQGLVLVWVCIYFLFCYAVLLRHAVCVLLAKSLPSWQKTNLRGGILLPTCDFLNIETEFEWHTCCWKLPELHKTLQSPFAKIVFYNYQLSSTTIRLSTSCRFESCLHHGWDLVERPGSTGQSRLPKSTRPANKPVALEWIQQLMPRLHQKKALPKTPFHLGAPSWILSNRNVVNQISASALVSGKVVILMRFQIDSANAYCLFTLKTTTALEYLGMSWTLHTFQQIHCQVSDRYLTGGTKKVKLDWFSQNQVLCLAKAMGNPDFGLALSKVTSNSISWKYW